MFSFFKKKLGSPPSITPAAQAATAAQPGTPDAVPAVLPPPATSPAGATIAPAVASAPDRIATSRMRPAAAQPGLPEAVGLADSPTTSEPVGTPAARQGWMDKLKAGLRKTGSSIAGVFTGAQIDDALYEDLETALLMADTGVKATAHLLVDLKFRVVDNGSTRPSEVKGLLVDGLAHMLSPLQKSLVIGQYAPTVIMVTGVNGAGKTTSIGKLTRHLADSGASVLLAAADTFRAAAREQLGVWADRNTVDIISQDGGDPAAVSFDAVSAGKARGRDVVLIDTAGRLPTQLHLMEELKKIKRVIQKTGVVTDRALATGSANPLPGAGDPAASSLPPHEILLVIDGNTGQNALNQVKAFDDALGLTGLIVTKLDGTAKGGVLAAIARERPIPVYFIGVGEKLEDLETFNAREFAQALLS